MKAYAAIAGVAAKDRLGRLLKRLTDQRTCLYTNRDGAQDFTYSVIRGSTNEYVTSVSK